MTKHELTTWPLTKDHRIGQCPKSGHGVLSCSCKGGSRVNLGLRSNDQMWVVSWSIQDLGATHQRGTRKQRAFRICVCQAEILWAHASAKIPLSRICAQLARFGCWAGVEGEYKKPHSSDHDDIHNQLRIQYADGAGPTSAN